MKVPLLIAIALVAVTLAVYFQVGNHQFLNLDDNSYVTDNSHVASGLSGANIRWAFTSVEASNWHPLTWLSHMADVQLYGMNPRGHHLTSVAIHTAAALCLLLLLVRMTGDLWPSAFVAALFALHPLHVESVAWVAERKDVLSALFCFLTLLAYVEYVARRKLWLYMLTLGLFALGLMAKPMLVTLPLVMLMLDYWPLGRREAERQEPRGLRLITEKIPFFACSVLSGLITIYAQQHGGAMAALTTVPLLNRCQNALAAYVTYLGKTLWPRDLAVLYPFPAFIPLWQSICSLSLLIILTAIVFRIGRRHPCLMVGWFWFIITLVPVIGIIQVGSQAMADRYTYIPTIGLFIMAAWGIPELTKGMRQQKAVVTLLAATVIFTSAVLTRQQLGYWRDNVSLYRHTLQITTGNYIIHNNLGIALAGSGQLNEAIREYQRALQIFPDHANAHYNLGTALQTKGFLNAALKEYQETLRITPDDPDARINLGRIFASQGRMDEAIREYRLVLLTNPGSADVHYNLGLALSRTGCLDEAIQEYRQTLLIDPKNSNANFSLKLSLAQKKVQAEPVK
jgi:Tfp pilus assembly protein PilF